MIHERKLSKQLVIDGPLTTCVAVVKATLSEIECSIAIQNEGFQNLVLGSSVSLDEVLKLPSIGTWKLRRLKVSDWLKLSCDYHLNASAWKASLIGRQPSVAFAVLHLQMLGHKNYLITCTHSSSR